MDVDMNALRSLVSEREIPFEVVVEAIERALETAYHHTPGAQPVARVELDRSTGHVAVFATETDQDGTVLREWDDTPEGFGRVAATTARQVILQRLRDAEDEATFGAWSGRDGDLVSGVIQQGPDPHTVLIDLGPLEAQLPAAEQVPGEQYVHGERLRCYVVGVRKGSRGPIVTVSRTHPGLVKLLFALDVPVIADGSV
jgi:N utilization substance protein A